jgi:putative ABC transport system permease protein
MNLLSGIKLFVWIIGIMTLIAGIVGVSNIMIIVVKERTKEIGIRKAIGASPQSIIGLVLQESILITSIAGFTGLLSASGILYLVNSIGIDSDFFKQPQVDLKVALSATFIIIIAGAIAGLVPAIKAAKIHPIEALRSY